MSQMCDCECQFVWVYQRARRACVRICMFLYICANVSAMYPCVGMYECSLVRAFLSIRVCICVYTVSMRDPMNVFVCACEYCMWLCDPVRLCRVSVWACTSVHTSVCVRNAVRPLSTALLIYLNLLEYVRAASICTCPCAFMRGCASV